MSKQTDIALLKQSLRGLDLERQAIKDKIARLETTNEKPAVKPKPKTVKTNPKTKAKK